MMSCKQALQESGGDTEKALELLRVKQGKKIEDRQQRQTTQGTIGQYVHFNHRIGAMVVVRCETDFVAQTDELQEFAKDLAMHVATMDPQHITVDEVPQETVDYWTNIYVQEAADKPEHIREKIAAGKLAKHFSEIVLLEQPHVHMEKYESKTVGELLDELRARTGEHVVIGEIHRFAV